MRKMYRVFVSSTYEDLKEERTAVMQTLHRTIYIKNDRQFLTQTDPAAVIHDEPEPESVRTIFIKIQQPSLLPPISFHYLLSPIPAHHSLLIITYSLLQFPLSPLSCILFPYSPFTIHCYRSPDRAASSGWEAPGSLSPEHPRSRIACTTH